MHNDLRRGVASREQVWARLSRSSLGRASRSVAAASASMVALGVFGLAGLGVALLLPSEPVDADGTLDEKPAPRRGV